MTLRKEWESGGKGVCGRTGLWDGVPEVQRPSVAHEGRCANLLPQRQIGKQRALGGTNASACEQQTSWLTLQEAMGFSDSWRHSDIPGICHHPHFPNPRVVRGTTPASSHSAVTVPGPPSSRARARSVSSAPR